MRTTMGPHTHMGRRSTFGRVRGIAFFSISLSLIYSLFIKALTDQTGPNIEENIQVQWEEQVLKSNSKEQMLYHLKKS